MSRKPRFKVQRLNQYDAVDIADYGRKQWTPVYDDHSRLGFTLTREGADSLYWQMAEMWPSAVYRIVEKR